MGPLLCSPLENVTWSVPYWKEGQNSHQAMTLLATCSRISSSAFMPVSNVLMLFTNF